MWKGCVRCLDGGAFTAVCHRVCRRAGDARWLLPFWQMPILIDRRTRVGGQFRRRRATSRDARANIEPAAGDGTIVRLVVLAARLLAIQGVASETAWAP